MYPAVSSSPLDAARSFSLWSTKPQGNRHRLWTRRGKRACHSEAPTMDEMRELIVNRECHPLPKNVITSLFQQQREKNGGKDLAWKQQDMFGSCNRNPSSPGFVQKYGTHSIPKMPSSNNSGLSSGVQNRHTPKSILAGKEHHKFSRKKKEKHHVWWEKWFPFVHKAIFG